MKIFNKEKQIAGNPFVERILFNSSNVHGLNSSYVKNDCIAAPKPTK